MHERMKSAWLLDWDAVEMVSGVVVRGDVKCAAPPYAK